VNRTWADISNWTTRFDAGAYAAGGHILLGVLATDGATFVSEKYVKQVSSAHAHGIAVVHYHFARPEDHPDGAGEMGHFWSTVQPHWRAGDRLALDVERNHPNGGDALIGYAWTLDRHLIKISGIHAWLYAERSRFTDLGRRFNTSSGKRWAADYSRSLFGWFRRLGLVAQQTTDGQAGWGPKHFAGIGPCDGNILTGGEYRQLLRERRARRKSGK
jgi:hypothetical protein